MPVSPAAPSMATRCRLDASGMFRMRSDDRVRAAGRLRVCAEQAPADGFLDQRQGLPRLARFGLGGLCPEFHRRELILNGDDP